jgi:hypothetical protein
MEYFIIGLIVLAGVTAVAVPFFRKSASDAIVRDDDALEGLIADYRVSLKAGTVCDKCLKNNPTGSNYCADCGLELGERTPSS